MTHLIGISGAAGAGKDTLARGIVQHFGYWSIQPLAQPLKMMLSTLVRLIQPTHNPDDWDNREWKELSIYELGVSPRFLAQTLGTEWGRQAVMDDFWLKIAAARIKNRPDYCEGVVIPDVRFENEAQWLKSQGGILLKVVRPGNPERVDNPGHASEAGIPDQYVDYTIENVEGRSHLAIAEARMIVHRMLLLEKAS